MLRESCFVNRDSLLKMKKIKDNSLYFVTSQEYAKQRTTYDAATLAITGGIDILQMREKQKPQEELIKLGKKLSFLCTRNDIIFIVNDDPYLAEKIGADGVHLGQEDILKYPLEKTRQILGKNRIIGISTHSVNQFEKANSEDFDYIAFGPIFPTKTKDYFIGIKDIEKVLEISAKPVIFVGGITLSNIDEALNKGARNIAVIRAIMQAEDIVRMVRTLKKKMTRRM